MKRPLLFDSHLDLAWNAVTWKRDLSLSLDELNQQDRQFDDEVWRGRATISLPEMKQANMAVCLATVMGRVPYGSSQVHGGSLDFPTHENTYAFAQGQLAYYRAMERCGAMRQLRTTDELRDHWANWEGHEPDDSSNDAHAPLGFILAMEGSDAIIDPAHAQSWYDDGLRCASLVHYGSSKYASGTGDDGPVTEAGKLLLAEFQRLGIVLDTTHLCDQSFFQALDNFDGPVLASHQNCRALVPGIRQFSDEQIRLLVERGGILGIAFDAWMLSPGWIRGETSREVVKIQAALDHVDHICQLVGNDQHVAIGSDLDGGYGTEQTPSGLDSIADLQVLADGLSERGYSESSIKRIFGVNWFEFFCRHLTSPSGAM